MFLPVGGGPTVRRRPGALRSSTASARAGSCRCTTARLRVNFLEPADAFVATFGNAAVRLEGASFETGELPDGPVVVVPTAP